MRPFAIGTLALVLTLAASACRSTGAGHGRKDPDAGSCDCAAILRPPAESCALDLEPAGPVALDRKPVHLVFEGGGVKGVAYAGALQVIGARGMLDDVRSVAGTSAGSITALVVALGFTPDEVETIIVNLDFDDFRDGTFLTDSFRLYERYGWYQGRYAKCVFECVVKQKLGSPNATFADLHQRAAEDPSFKDLYIVATDLDLRDSVVMSYEDERFADLPLAEGVRASMSIPFYFAAQEIDGATFVDGGVLRNYPIDLFDAAGGKPDPDTATLGFFLGSLDEKKEEITDLLVFTETVFATLLEQQVDELCEDPGQEANIRRTAFLDPLGIATTDFGLTPAQKCALIRSGAKGTAAYLRGPSERCPDRLQRKSTPDPDH
jgi:NTE family protein